jgi:hypothetical protein
MLLVQTLCQLAQARNYRLFHHTANSWLANSSRSGAPRNLRPGLQNTESIGNSVHESPSHGPLNFRFIDGTTVEDVGGTRLRQQKIVDEDRIGAGAEKSAHRVHWANHRGFTG